MNRLTEIQQLNAISPMRVSQSQDFPVVYINEKEFVVMPADVYQTIKANKAGWTILAISGGLLAVSTAAAIIASAFRAPIAASEPVIVEKQVVVPTNCLIWCGQ